MTCDSASGLSTERTSPPVSIQSTKVGHRRQRAKNAYLALPVCLIALTGGWTYAISDSTDLADDEWPAWADAHESDHQRIAVVNEGDLVFLPQQPSNPVPYHGSRLVITQQSLADGWVLMEQCHERLDRVAEAQIVFNPGRTRELEVLSFHNMDTALVESNTIQLRGIREASKICARLETRALHAIGNQRFELRNGPFMRRFLDGYYPLQLSIRVEYPSYLELVDHHPKNQPGYAMSSAPGLLAIEALFEGELRTRFGFVARRP